MTAESNKHFLHRFMELMNSGDPALAGELISPSALFHVPGRADPVLGPAGYLAVQGVLRTGFPDMRWTLEDMTADANHVAARFTVRGTHGGPFLGAPPTGKIVVVQSVGFYRLVAGQVLEAYVQPDVAAYLRWIRPATRARARPSRGETQAICWNRSSLAFTYAAQS